LKHFFTRINAFGFGFEKSKKSIDLVGETSIGAIESVSSGTEIKLNFGKNESKSKESPSYLHLLR
jgi:hypothetical protein